MTEIAVVGTINYDRVILPGGESFQGLGGILYNVLTLAPFVGAEDRIIPIGRVGVERRRQVESLLAPWPAIDRSNLLWNEGGSNETVLTYRSADRREEALVERVAPLTWEEIAPAAAAHHVVINMISGKEVTAPLVARIASEGKGKILLDIQSLTFTFDRASKRSHAQVADWREWLGPAETVKGNEQEMRALAGGGDEPFGGSIEDLARLVLDAGPAVVLITRGTQGHCIARRFGSGARCESFPAPPVPAERVVDTTGCGDAFTSGYLLGSLRGEDPVASSLLGASLAAEVCTLQGVEALGALADPAITRGSLYRSFREGDGG